MDESRLTWAEVVKSGIHQGKGAKEEVEFMARISCLHGGGGGAEGKTEEAILANWSKLAKDDPIRRAHAVAASRLPLADMPELIDGLLHGGTCVGFLDPVSNIILNALNFLLLRRRRPNKPPPLDHLPLDRITWSSVAQRSRVALITFMRTYFRYLSHQQAVRYIRLAGGDLVVAIRLVELEQYGVQHRVYGLSSPSQLDLSGDRAQFALKVAVIAAEAPNPDDYPSPDDILLLFQPMLLRLEEITRQCVSLVGLEAMIKGQVLSVQDVNSILEFLEFQQCAEIPPVELSFQRRSDKLQCLVGKKHIAEIHLRPATHDDVFCVSCLRSPYALRTQIESCLSAAAAIYTQIRPEDAPPTCEYIRYAKMCLVDTIHAFYLNAISLLPRDGLQKHLAGILAAGHCYGTMDPVSNIILNSIWYNLAFPMLDDEPADEVAPDVLDMDSILRMEIHSLDGLVATVCTVTGYSEHMAVEYLCCMHCDLTAILNKTTQDTLMKAFKNAGEAAKHPRHTEHASFLRSLAPEKVDKLRSLLSTKGGYVIPSVNLELLYTLIVAAPHYPNVPTAVCFEATMHRQRILHKKLEKLLHSYVNQHPWEPAYKVHAICGVSKDNRLYAGCYHINFLASPCEASTSTPAAHMLFFAEVFESDSSKRFGRIHTEESCCPLPDYDIYHTHLGRCSLCEFDYSNIVHPPFGSHMGAECTELIRSLDYMYDHAERALQPLNTFKRA